MARGCTGSADTVRDVRGFAVKFYRDEGNFDLVGNNERVDYIHVSFSKQLDDVPPTLATGLTVRLYVWHRYRCSSSSTLASPIPTTRSRRRRPHYNFISLTTESAHMIMWVLSGRAIPRSYRTMQGFGVHSFLLVNKEGRRRFAKFHWIPKLGTHPLVWDEAQKLAGVDPDFLVEARPLRGHRGRGLPRVGPGPADRRRGGRAQVLGL